MLIHAVSEALSVKGAVRSVFYVTSVVRNILQLQTCQIIKRAISSYTAIERVSTEPQSP